MEYKVVPAFNFDFFTPMYDFFSDIFGFGNNQREKIINLLKIKPNEKILDVGCGTGSLLIQIKKSVNNIEISGIDIDKKILDLARKKIESNGLNIKLIESGAEKLPFKADSFDVVVSTLIFHHLPLDIKKQATEEIFRVLKPNGRFLLVDFGKSHGFMRILYLVEKLLNLPEAKYMRDNLDGVIPSILQKVGFNYTEVSPRYRGIQFFLAKKS